MTRDVFTHAFSRNNLGQTNQQSATKVNTPLLALFLRNYHDLITLINFLKQKLNFTF